MKNIFVVISFFLILGGKAMAVDSPNFFLGKIDKENNQINVDQEKIKYLRIILPRFLHDCLQSKCSTANDLEILKKMETLSYSQNIGVVFFADSEGKVNPPLTPAQASSVERSGLTLGKELFYIPGTNLRRTAVSSVGPGPIFFNTDLIKNISFGDSFKIMLHEFGHQMGMIDTEHRSLDELAARISPFFESKLDQQKFKNITVSNHFSLTARSVLNDPYNSQDLDLYMMPHLIIEDHKKMINLTIYLQKVISKILDFQRLRSVWIESLRPIETGKDSTLIISGHMGYALSNSSDKFQMIEGDFKILLPYLINGDEVEIDSDRAMSISLMDLESVANSRSSNLKLISISGLKSISSGENIEVEAVIANPDHLEVTKIDLNIDFDQRYFVGVPILSHYLVIKGQEIEKLNESSFKVKFTYKISDFYPQSILAVRNLRLEVKENVRDIRLYPKEKYEISIKGKEFKDIFKLKEVLLMSSTISFFNPSQNKVIVNKVGEFVPFSFFKVGNINSYYLEILMSKPVGQILGQVSILMEELDEVPLAPIQKFYSLTEIESQSEMENLPDSIKFKLTIDPKKLKSNHKSFRPLGMSLLTNIGEGGNFIFE